MRLVVVKENEISEKPFLWFTLRFGYVLRCGDQVKAFRILARDLTLTGR